MVFRQKVAKDAWAWTDSVVHMDDITSEHIRQSYLLNQDCCTVDKKSHRKNNCKANPYCTATLGQIGFRKRLQEFKVTANNSQQNYPLRSNNECIGLRNLGATCYMNAYLQVWFNDAAFRSMVYQWRSESIEHALIIRTLQRVFAELDLSKKSSVDPEPFLVSLNLRAEYQQDAHEFSNLFFSRMDEIYELNSTLNYNGENLWNTLKQNYCGTLGYSIICRTCGNKSVNSSTFCELDLSIKVNKTLHSSLNEFIKTEPLINDNKYMCQFCHCLRDADRHITLNSLPNTLNFQLLRFVFDRKLMQKKKITSEFQFSNILDMSKYIDCKKASKDKDKDYLYQLVAVLEHQGKSAHEGHYIAYIRHQLQGDDFQWKRYNDEDVSDVNHEEISYDDSTSNQFPGQTNKKMRKGTDYITSRNSYMLVYKKVSDVMPIADDLKDQLPLTVIKEIEDCNNTYEQEVQEKYNELSVSIDIKMQSMNIIDEIINNMKIENFEDYSWIPVKWLLRLINTADLSKIPIVETQSLLCRHKLMCPDKVILAKCLPPSAINIIYENFGIPEVCLDQNSTCKSCVKDRWLLMQAKAMVAKDVKQVSALVKKKEQSKEQWEDDNMFWVGKLTLKNFSQILINYLMEDEDEEQVKSESEVPFKFNEDLLCDHNRLITDESLRKLVTMETWNCMTRHYKLNVRKSKFVLPEFKASDSTCFICRRDEDAEIKALEEMRRARDIEHSLLGELYHVSKRKSNTALMEKQSILFIISSEFLSNWREYIRYPARRERPICLDNSDIFCKHNLLTCDPFIGNCDSYELVTLSEFRVLKSFYTSSQNALICKSRFSLNLDTMPSPFSAYNSPTSFSLSTPTYAANSNLVKPSPLSPCNLPHTTTTTTAPSSESTPYIIEPLFKDRISACDVDSSDTEISSVKDGSTSKLDQSSPAHDTSTSTAEHSDTPTLRSDSPPNLVDHQHPLTDTHPGPLLHSASSSSSISTSSPLTATSLAGESSSACSCNSKPRKLRGRPKKRSRISKLKLKVQSSEGRQSFTDISPPSNTSQHLLSDTSQLRLRRDPARRSFSNSQPLPDVHCDPQLRVEVNSNCSAKRPSRKRTSQIRDCEDIIDLDPDTDATVTSTTGERGARGSDPTVSDEDIESEGVSEGVERGVRVEATIGGGGDSNDIQIMTNSLCSAKHTSTGLDRLSSTQTTPIAIDCDEDEDDDHTVEYQKFTETSEDSEDSQKRLNNLCSSVRYLDMDFQDSKKEDAIFIATPQTNKKISFEHEIYQLYPGTCFDCKTMMDEERDEDQYHYNCQLIYIHKIVASGAEHPDSTNYKENTIRRRGQRNRKTKEDSRFRVNSSDTLKQLKLLIMNYYGVSPIDQTLFESENGPELGANSKCSAEDIDSLTLKELKILPDSLLYLKVAEIKEDICEKYNEMETGFQGTGLGGSF